MKGEGRSQPVSIPQEDQTFALGVGGYTGETLRTIRYPVGILTRQELSPLDPALDM